MGLVWVWGVGVHGVGVWVVGGLVVILGVLGLECDVMVGDFVPLLAAAMMGWGLVVGRGEAAEEVGEDAFVAHCVRG